MASSYIISYALAAYNIPLLVAENNGYPALGIFTWLTGLPCWLLGCWLAELPRDRFPIFTRPNIWFVRIGVLCLSFLLHVAKFHAPYLLGSNVLTLNVFAICVVIWLGLEIRYFEDKDPINVLERSGAWSYSLYLIHPVAGVILSDFLSPSLYRGVVIMAASLLLSLTFFWLVERPSHLLARRVARLRGVRSGHAVAPDFTLNPTDIFTARGELLTNTQQENSN